MELNLYPLVQTNAPLVYILEYNCHFTGIEEKGQKEKFTFEEFFGHDYKIHRFSPHWRKGI